MSYKSENNSSGFRFRSPLLNSILNRQAEQKQRAAETWNSQVEVVWLDHKSQDGRWKNEIDILYSQKPKQKRQRNGTATTRHNKIRQISKANIFI